MSLLELTGLSHTFGDSRLYQNAELSLYKGEHVGVVGQNGAGKSTLIEILTGGVVPDEGRVVWQPGLRLGYLDQHAKLQDGLTISSFLKSAYEELYALEKKMLALYEDGGGQAMEEAASLQEKLEASHFYEIDFKAEKVANGLGLGAIGLGRRLSELSGGQRAKVILGKLLLEEPAVLLLDEPTNFLDREHIEWLSGFLAASKNAFLVVSHDERFLEAIADHICDVANGTIRKYNGTYREYQKQKERMTEDYARRYASQKRELEKTEAFIRKNIAGVNSRIAKGRRKQLERVERMAPPPGAAAKPRFRFRELPAPMKEQIEAKGLSIGYDRPLLPKLDFTVRGGQKVAVTGFNGVGKSTLLKTLLGRLPALDGTVRLADALTVGYFPQELKWTDRTRTPLEILAEAEPSLTEKERRTLLSRCGISSAHAMQPVGTLSGGEQAKTKLCLMTLRPCNVLMLDEPTNHLDAAAKEALKTALTAFGGTVLLVSHEEAFYRDWAETVYEIKQNR